MKCVTGQTFNFNMIVRITDLVFLFVIRIRFPGGKSVEDLFQNRYGEAYVKKIRRFEKCDFQLRECYLDLRCLLDCKKNGVISRFKLANINTLKILMCINKKYQTRLLEEEIKSK